MNVIKSITQSKPFYVVAGAGDLAVKVARDLPSTAVNIVAGTPGRADAVYSELLSRGRRVTGSIRRQQATQELQRDTATTVQRTKAAAKTVKSAAADTTRSARTTARSATKTTRSATKAVADGAGKVGS